MVLAFSDLLGMEEKTALRLASSFGGGIGRMRQTCGTLLGAFIVIGVLYGYDDPKAVAEKNCHYARIQEIAEVFRLQNGSIVCRELLGAMGRDSSPIAEARTEQYYKKRPCPELCYSAARAVEEYIKEHPAEDGKDQL